MSNPTESNNHQKDQTIEHIAKFMQQVFFIHKEVK